MADPKKTEEIAKKIQDISKTAANHESNIGRIEREKNDKVKYYDQQIKQKKDEISRIERESNDKVKYYDQQSNRDKEELKKLKKQIDDLKRQM